MYESRWKMYARTKGTLIGAYTSTIANNFSHLSKLAKIRYVNLIKLVSRTFYF